MTLLDQIKADREKDCFWRPVRTDIKWLDRLRKDYDDKSDWDDDSLRDYFDGHRKYATTWDHIGDAYEDFEPLADRFFAMETALLAAGELADADTVEQMISDVFHEGGSVRDAAMYISAAFRKAIEVK